MSRWWPPHRYRPTVVQFEEDENQRVGTSASEYVVVLQAVEEPVRATCRATKRVSRRCGAS